MLPETICSVVQHCAKIKAFRQGFSLHAAVFKTGIQSDVFVSNQLLNIYAKFGKISSARQVFDEMSHRNLVSWSAMISGALSACASLQAGELGRQIHAQTLKLGYASISFVFNSIISMYMKCGCFCDALVIFDEVLEPNSVSYNALITGYVENQEYEKGLEMFKLMHGQGLAPDWFTFAGVLESCVNLNDLHRGMMVHCQTVKVKLDSTAFVGNVIMTMYSKFNLMEEVEKVFIIIEEKDVISWNTFIAGCSHCMDHEKGIRVFKEMSNECTVRPDEFTFASVLAACAGLASIHYGRQIHGHLIRAKLYQDVGLGNALVNMYAKCGSIGYAYKIFNRMLHHNLVSWNTIITAYGNHGLGEMALELFEQMKAAGVNPDSVTFTGLLMACKHAGLVDKGEFYFNSMEEIYGIAPQIEHFSCLIDLLGRAGKLQEAEKYMKKSPFSQDPIVLGSLLSSCWLHGDVIIGERLAKQLLKFQPVTTSPYVLVANLYASGSMWSDVAEARRKLKGSGLKKEAGYSMIELKGNFEKFTVGNHSHRRIEEIKRMLEVLGWAAAEVSFIDIIS